MAQDLAPPLGSTGKPPVLEIPSWTTSLAKMALLGARQRLEMPRPRTIQILDDMSAKPRNQASAKVYEGKKSGQWAIELQLSKLAKTIMSSAEHKETMITILHL